MTPSHYRHTKIEPIKVINSINLGFNLGSAYKYLARAGHKGSKAEDLKKAIDFIRLEIERPTFSCNDKKIQQMGVVKWKETGLVSEFMRSLMFSCSIKDNFKYLESFILEFLEPELQKSTETTTTKD